MNEIERVREFIKETKLPLNIIELDADTSTAYLAAKALGTEVGQIAKSILFKASNNQFFMIVAAGDIKIDNKAVKKLVGSRARMANSEEVLEITGFNIGGVCPFALKHHIPIYLDDSLQCYDIVYTAAGTSNTVLPITYQQLRQITKGTPCNVSQAG